MLSYTCTVSYVFFFKQKTAYEMRISDWSSDVCSSYLLRSADVRRADFARRARRSGQVHADRRLQRSGVSRSLVPRPCRRDCRGDPRTGRRQRSEEHTSELQSLMRISYAAFCLKKKNKSNSTNNNISSLKTDAINM